MHSKTLDHAEKIEALTQVIKSICEENNLNKQVVVDDFCFTFFPKEEYIIIRNENAGS